MDSSSINLIGTEIEQIQIVDQQVVVQFSRAMLVKTMSGSDESTLWHQPGKLIFDSATVEGEYPRGPLICSGGDVGENIYTYRDMIPIPFQSAGRVFCDLRFEGNEAHLRVEGKTVKLEMADRPHYIDHIRPDAI